MTRTRGVVGRLCLIAMLAGGVACSRFKPVQLTPYVTQVPGEGDAVLLYCNLEIENRTAENVLVLHGDAADPESVFVGPQSSSRMQVALPGRRGAATANVALTLLVPRADTTLNRMLTLLDEDRVFKLYGRKQATVPLDHGIPRVVIQDRDLIRPERLPEAKP